MSELSLALQSFATAIKSLSSGITYAILYILNLVGIKLSSQIVGLIAAVCTIYAANLVIKDEFIKKLIMILLALLILGYIGLNSEEFMKNILSLIGVHF